jgi:hypothetical protein
VEEAIRTKPKFGGKTDNKENMETSVPHTIITARILQGETDQRTARLLRHAREGKTTIDISS